MASGGAAHAILRIEHDAKLLINNETHDPRGPPEPRIRFHQQQRAIANAKAAASRQIHAHTTISLSCLLLPALHRDAAMVYADSAAVEHLNACGSSAALTNGDDVMSRVTVAGGYYPSR